MSQGKSQTQLSGQAGASGKLGEIGLEVGGVHSKAEESWVDLWTLKAETRQQLKNARRDAACSHTRQRSEGLGDGSQEIETPDKIRKLQRTLYRKAKAEPKTSRMLAMKRLGKPDTGNPSVRFDEGSESDGHWLMPFNPSAPAYSTDGAWLL